MSYTYAQRKRPQGQTQAPPAQTAAEGPVSAPLRADTAGAGNADGLASAMQERMTNTFGDLSAVKSYRPPSKEASAPPAPYAGPIDHAVSAAGPSPAVAGPMQAFRGWGKKSKPKPAPKLRKVTKTKEEIASEQADRMFRVGAGVLGDARDVALSKEQIMDSVLPAYLEEEKQKGGKDYARRAKRRAEQYYRAHTPKRKSITSSKDKKWYNNITNNASLDLIRELSVRRKQAALDLNEYREGQGLERPGEDKHKLDFESAYSDQGRKLGIYDYILGDMTNAPAMETYMEQNPADEESEEDQIKVENAFSLLGSGNGGKYAGTEEGKQQSLLLRKQEIGALKDTYSGKKTYDDSLNNGMIDYAPKKKKGDLFD